MKRTLVAVGLAAIVVLVVAAVSAAAKGSSKGSIHVIEHATSDAVTNGSAADAAGNVLTFANDVFDSADHNKVGSDQVRPPSGEVPARR